MYESSRGESGGGISPPPPSEPGVKNSAKKTRKKNKNQVVVSREREVGVGWTVVYGCIMLEYDITDKVFQIGPF